MGQLGMPIFERDCKYCGVRILMVPMALHNGYTALEQCGEGAGDWIIENGKAQRVMWDIYPDANYVFHVCDAKRVQ
jgi:hypothetical protein